MSTLPPTGQLIRSTPRSRRRRSPGSPGSSPASRPRASGSPARPRPRPVDVLFGTQTGNAEFLADELVAGARARGLGGRATPLDAVTPEQLAACRTCSSSPRRTARARCPTTPACSGTRSRPRRSPARGTAVRRPRARRHELRRVLPGRQAPRHPVRAARRDAHPRPCRLRRRLRGPRRALERRGPGPSRRRRPARRRALPPRRRVGHLVGPVGGAGASRASGRGRSGTSATRTGRPRREPLLSSPRSAKEIRHVEFDLGSSASSTPPATRSRWCRTTTRRSSTSCSHTSGPTARRSSNGRPLAEVLRTDREIRTPSKDLVADLVQRAPASELAASRCRTGTSTSRPVALGPRRPRPAP